MCVSRALMLLVFGVLACSGLPSKQESTVITVPPNIISRSQWGARQPTEPVIKLTINPAPFVIIHHSASDGCTTQAICQARVRSFQNYHIDQKHWDDIGYNFLVGEDGNVYEGRGWGVKGAHSVPYNARSIGICMIGKFEFDPVAINSNDYPKIDREPQPAAIKAVKRLIAYGVSSGKINPSYTVYGHRQTTTTECPGTKLYELIQSWPHWQRN